MPDRGQSILTGDRLIEYKKASKIWISLVVLLVLIQLFASGKSFYGELLIFWLIWFTTWSLYLLSTKKTFWHLRKQELKHGQDEAKEILKSVGIKNETKTK